MSVIKARPDPEPEKPEPSPEPSKVATTLYTAGATKEMCDGAIGKTRAEAEAYFKINGLKMRVARIEGRNCVGTQDVDKDRVNVEIENDKVKSILSIG